MGARTFLSALARGSTSKPTQKNIPTDNNVRKVCLRHGRVVAYFLLAMQDRGRFNAARETMRLLIASLFGCLALFQAGAESTVDLVAGGFRLKGAVIHLYSGAEAEPAAVIRLDKVYTDYQSKGFFRIGLLPIGVMEGVTFELHHPGSVTNGLTRLHQWLGANAAKRLELRRINFLVPGPVTNRLEASRARVAAGGNLEMFDGVRFVSGTNQIQAMRGMLQITGLQAGLLVMATTPPWTNNLFGRIDIP